MFKFDWTGFNEENMREANECKDEDEIFGDVLVEITDKIAYLVDIHHTFYSSRDKFFDLEVYEASYGKTWDMFENAWSREEVWSHGDWLGYINDIKTATNYKRFCKRAENLIIEFLKDFIGRDDDYE